jgi:hypothetical protein
VLDLQQPGASHVGRIIEAHQELRVDPVRLEFDDRRAPSFAPLAAIIDERHRQVQA